MTWLTRARRVAADDIRPVDGSVPGQSFSRISSRLARNTRLRREAQQMRKDIRMTTDDDEFWSSLRERSKVVRDA